MRVFVTGASGHIASAVIPELIGAGHEVVGLARSDTAAAAVTALGASARRGDLDGLDGIKQAAVEADGVIHLAFNHAQMRSGNMGDAVATELAVVAALGDALAGSGKPLVSTSGVAAPGALGRPSTEDDPGAPGGRTDSEIAVLALAERGVRSAVVRLPPITHSTLDRHGFAHTLIAVAQRSGISGYPGDGANRWPTVHSLDAGHLYRLALERAQPGTRWHAVGDEGIPMRDIAESIGNRLGLPTASIPDDQVQTHFGPLAMLIGRDIPASSQITRQVLGWEPTHPGLLADFDNGAYFPAASPRG